MCNFMAEVCDIMVEMCNSIIEVYNSMVEMRNFMVKVCVLAAIDRGLSETCIHFLFCIRDMFTRSGGFILFLRSRAPTCRANRF